MMSAAPGGLEVGRVSLRVVPDTSRLGPDLKVALGRIESQTDLKVSTSIDTTMLDAQARAAVEQAQLAAGSLDIKTNVDSSQLHEGATAARDFGSGLSGVATAAIALGPTLIPLVAVLGTLGAALAAPAVLGAGGLTLFGFITGAAIKQTETQSKQIDSLKKAVDSARQSLANAQASSGRSAANSLASAQASAQASLKSAHQALGNATTAAGVASAQNRIAAANASLHARQSSIAASQSATVANAQDRVTEAVAAYQAALHALTPAQTKFLAAQAGLKAAFKDLLASTGNAVLGPVTTALRLLSTILPTLKPVLTSFADVFNGFLSRAGDATKSKGFTNFIHLIATQGVDAFSTFAGIIGNTFLALGRLGRLLLPFGQGVLKSLGKASAAFASFAGSPKASKDVRSLLNYVKTNGPKVGAALAGIAAGAGAIVVAFAPIGGIVLTEVGNFGDAIASIPADKLTTIATSVVALVVALKVAGPLMSAITFAITSPEIVLAVAAVAALAGGFVLLYQRSRPTRDILADLGNFFKTELLPVIEQAAHQVMPALNAAIHEISRTIKNNKGLFETFGQLFLTFASGAVVAAMLALVGAIRGIGGAFEFGTTQVHIFADVMLLSAAASIRAFGLMFKFILGSFAGLVHAAAAAFGWIPGIGPKIKAASKSFDDFAASVNNNFQGAAADIDGFRRKLDEVGTKPKKFKVDIDDLDARKKLDYLQAFKLRDKDLSVTARFQLLEQTPGAGGGIGRHPSGNPTSLPFQPAPVPAPPHSPTHPGGTQSDGRSALVNIERMETTDTADILRKTGRVLRGRAGGGVVLAGSN